MEQMKSQSEFIDELLKKQNLNEEAKPATAKTNNKKKKRNRKKN